MAVEQKSTSGEPRFVDLGTLKSLIGLVSEHQSELEWLLNQQSALRAEYLSFFKRDIREIAENIQSLIPEPTAGTESGTPGRATELLLEVIGVVRKDIEASMALVDAALQRLSESQDPSCESTGE